MRCGAMSCKCVDDRIVSTMVVCMSKEILKAPPNQAIWKSGNPEYINVVVVIIIVVVVVVAAVVVLMQTRLIIFQRLCMGYQSAHR